MPIAHRIRLAALVVAAFLAVASACNSGARPGAVTPLPGLPIATQPPSPPPAATPEPEDLGEGMIALIQRGWDSILDYYITPPEPRGLLVAAWREVAAEARSRASAVPPEPSFSGGRDEMWQAFSVAYLDLLRASPEDAWTDYRYAALTGMTRSLNDCHTFFLPPARADVLTDIRTGRGSGGVGLELAPVRPAYVRETIGGGPAQAAGIQPGDFLLTVDGQDVTALGIESIMELLRGDPGSGISLQVRRPSTGSVMTFPLTRALVRPPAAEGAVLAGGVGYIKIRSFTTGSALRLAVDELVAGFEAGGITAWVLDLRDNPGGDSDLELDGRFVGNVVAERTVLRDGGIEVNEGEGEPYPPRPLAVLVNGGTASVAEIFAAMLQDYDRGRVFGTATEKCAGFVNLENYPDQSTLGVTIAHSVTPRTQKPLWQTGVVPDVPVRQTQDDVAAGRDPVLDSALAWLKTQR